MRGCKSTRDDKKSQSDQLTELSLIQAIFLPVTLRMKSDQGSKKITHYIFFLYQYIIKQICNKTPKAEGKI